METVDLHEIQKSLEKNRKILSERIKIEEQESGSYKSTNPERSDLARQYDRRQRKKLLLARAQEQLSEVEAALQRLENGGYGVCLSCSQPISLERLRVIPSAAFCVRCQQQQE